MSTREEEGTNAEEEEEDASWGFPMPPDDCDPDAECEIVWPDDDDDEEEGGSSDGTKASSERTVTSEAFGTATTTTTTVVEEEDCYDLCESTEEDVKEEEEEKTVEVSPAVVRTALPAPRASVPKNRSRVMSDAQARRNLELRWALMASTDECDVQDMNSCGGMCDRCSGEGVVDCRFCDGTGFLMVGSTLYRGGKVCPVCSGGLEECSGCKGSGWVAKWNSQNSTLPLRP